MMRVICSVCRPFKAFIIALGLVIIGPGTLWGGIVYYRSEASFDAAAPGLPVDSFPGTGVYSAPYSNMAGLSVSTLLPGPDTIILTGRGVGTNYYGDTLILNFSPSVMEFGTTLLASANPGQPTFAGFFTVKIYDGSRHIGSTLTGEVAGGTAYIGAISTKPITKVEILFQYNSDAWTVANNVAFGSAGSVPESSPSSSAIPEPSSLTLAALSAVCLGIFMAARNRRAARHQLAG